jgi:hypothetical protein
MKYIFPLAKSVVLANPIAPLYAVAAVLGEKANATPVLASIDELFKVTGKVILPALVPTT